MKKIIIIGGGFAGLSASKRLSKEKKKLDITLIDIRKKLIFYTCSLISLTEGYQLICSPLI